uniref:TOG domain-containing protein n=1 Tax=Varanus komodoensis TaxID=61221 RepID=A0A8D2IYF9_VARKO
MKPCKSWAKSGLLPPQQSSTASFSTENVGSSEMSLDLRKAKSEGTVLKAKRLPNMQLPGKPSMKDGSSKLGPIFTIVPKAKEQRMKDEKALKVLRWNFSTPSSKYVEQLKAQMCGCLSNWLQEELFHSNFQHHIRALTVMTKHLEAEKDGVISCLDLILKWLSLRLFDTNTWVLMKTLEYLKRLFSLLIEERYQLMENEASAFLPYLLLKMGATKESILREVRAIVKQATLVYPPCKVFSFLLEGAQVKNANQRVGCLKELAWLLRTYGPAVCQPNPSKVLKTIITLTGDSNNAVHCAALKVIATARDVYGVETFKTIGNISDKHMSLLEERMKEAEAKPIREEKADQEVFSLAAWMGSVEVSRLNPGTGHHTGEDFCISHMDRAEVEYADSTAFCRNPKQADISPQSVRLASQTGSTTVPNINMAICNIAGGNISTSTEALVQIQEIIKQEGKVDLMSGHTNQLLIATSQQLKFIHRLHMTSEEEMRKEQVIELYSCVVCSMVSLFQVESLAQEASAGVLKDLLSSLITLLLDPPIEDLQEGRDIIQSVSLLITNVLEKSDLTRLFHSLLLLLQEGLAAMNLVAFSEMVAKCLWKAVKRLPQTISRVSLEQILLDIHIFLKAWPKEKLKQYESSYPIRALKVLLHTLCKLKGAEILDHLTLIENKHESELETHLQKIVRHSVELDVAESHQVASCPAEDRTDNTLAEIFRKINSKETARVGLEELYEYKEKQPEADLEPFLKNASLLFRSYVKHGLAVITSERESKQKISSPAEKEVYFPLVYSLRLANHSGGEKLNNKVNQLPKQKMCHRWSRSWVEKSRGVCGFQPRGSAAIESMKSHPGFFISRGKDQGKEWGCLE